MNSPSPPIDIDCDRYHAIFAVADVRAAIEFYTAKLGFWLAFAEGEPPTFAGVNIGHVQLFLQEGTPSPSGCAAYFVVSDADKLYKFHLESGAQVIETIADRSYGLRDYTVRDADGYLLTFGQ